MNIAIQAVKFTMNEDQKKFIDQKFKRIEYAEELITDIQQCAHILRKLRI